MYLRILSIIMLTCTILFALNAQENRRRGGGNWGGMTSAWGGGNFDQLSKSDKPEDLEQAALTAMLEELNYQMSIIRSKTINENTSVQTAREKAVAAQAAYLAVFEDITELKELSDQRKELEKNIRSMERNQMREAWTQIRELSNQQNEILNNNEAIKALKEARIAANSEFTIALREALAGLAEYIELQEQAEHIKGIQKMIREAQMAERMKQWGGNKRERGNPEKAKQEEGDKKGQDLKEF